jgi:hypothetical protein
MLRVKHKLKLTRFLLLTLGWRNLLLSELKVIPPLRKLA